MWMARQAVKELTAEGAKVELATYDGGHGWRGPLYADVKKGLEWLEMQAKTKD
jgi:predicted esterase